MASCMAKATASASSRALSAMPCCWKNAALQVSQPGMAFTATKGTLAAAASVLVSPPGLESITSAARMYTGT